MHWSPQEGLWPVEAPDKDAATRCGQLRVRSGFTGKSTGLDQLRQRVLDDPFGTDAEELVFSSISLMISAPDMGFSLSILSTRDLRYPLGTAEVLLLQWRWRLSLRIFFFSPCFSFIAYQY